MSTEKIIDLVVTFFVTYSFQVIAALIILAVGNFISLWLRGITIAFCEKKKLDITLSKFIGDVVRVIVIAFAVIIALGKFGITITPFIAAISAAAFGATYAIQGPLSNYAAGLSIIVGRPFKIGDTIEVVNVRGVVKDIKLASTILGTASGVVITIPNKHIVGEIIHNSGLNQMVKMTVGISYSTDPEKAVRLISDVLKKNPNVLQSPAPGVGIDTFGESSIDIGYAYWTPTTTYGDTKAAVNLAVFRALQAAQIEIPFPQREVRIVSQSAPVLNSR